MNIARTFWESQYDTNRKNHSKQNKYITEDFLHNIKGTYFESLIEKSIKILEFGCGTGELAKALIEKFDTINHIIGVDISDEAIKYANKKHTNIMGIFRNKRISFKVFDIMEEKSVVKFEPLDLIICSNTLEHFKNPHVIIDYLMQSAKYCILLVPYNQPCTDGYDDEGGAGHVFQFNEQAMASYNIVSEFKFTTKGWEYSSKGEQPLQWAVLIERICH